MRKIFILFSFVIFLFAAGGANAQVRRFTLPTATPTPLLEEDIFSSEAARLASPSAEELKKLEQIKKEDVTQPEETDEKQEFFELFKQRPAKSLSLTNGMAYAVQYSVSTGVPARTIMLILLLPFLATIIAFFRHVVGLPSIGLLVPIALSITLIATGVTSGIALLVTIVFASVFARIVLKNLKIMQLPKMSLSMMVVSIFVFAMLTVSASFGILTVRQLSIFPILLLILLSERIISLQMERSTGEALHITVVTLGLGILGFVLLSSAILQNIILLYPEVVLSLIPINIVVGRYFGLRLTEYIRFRPILKNASK